MASILKGSELPSTHTHTHKIKKLMLVNNAEYRELTNTNISGSFGRFIYSKSMWEYEHKDNMKNVDKKCNRL